MEPVQKNDEIDLRELFGILVSKLGVIFLSGVALGLIVMISTKLFIAPQYQSATKMYVLNKQNSDTLTSTDIQTSTLLTKDYAEIIRSRTVTESVIAQLELNLTHEKLVDKLTITTPTDTRIVMISVKDEDPYVARDIANTIRDTAAEHIQKVMARESINVVEEANIPSNEVSPNIIKNTIVGFVGGVFLAIVVVLFVYIMNDTIKTSEDIEHYLQLSTLGVIPLRENEKKKKRKVKPGKA